MDGGQGLAWGMDGGQGLPCGMDGVQGLPCGMGMGIYTSPSPLLGQQFAFWLGNLWHKRCGVIVQKKTSRNDTTAQRKVALRCAVASLRETYCSGLGAEMPELQKVCAKMRIAALRERGDLPMLYNWRGKPCTPKRCKLFSTRTA